jgi:hypothetical protein
MKKMLKMTHMLIDKNITACGLDGNYYGSYDGRDVDCRRCMKTKRYIVYMGKEKTKCTICSQMVLSRNITKDGWCKGCDNDARYER